MASAPSMVSSEGWPISVAVPPALCGWPSPVPCPGTQPCAVVPTGVHDTDFLALRVGRSHGRRVVESGFLLDRQGVQLGAGKQTRPRAIQATPRRQMLANRPDISPRARSPYNLVPAIRSQRELRSSPRGARARDCDADACTFSECR
jgi:hypothetical protein